MSHFSVLGGSVLPGPGLVMFCDVKKDCSHLKQIRLTVPQPEFGSYFFTVVFIFAVPISLTSLFRAGTVVLSSSLYLSAVIGKLQPLSQIQLFVS